MKSRRLKNSVELTKERLKSHLWIIMQSQIKKMRKGKTISQETVILDIFKNN